MLRQFLINTLKVGFGGSTLIGSTLYLSSDKLYTWGWNNFGQLGLGHSNTVYSPQIVPLIDVAIIVARSSVSAAIDKSGQLYTWGRSRFGLLGNGFSDNINVPTLVQSLKDLKFKNVACSAYHMGAVTVDGELYTWGNSDHGKLGHSYNSKIASREKYEFQKNLGSNGLPVKVDLPFKVKSIAMGDQFTLVLNEEGEIFVVGLNKKGMLGFDCKNAEETVFTKIEGISGIQKIDAGSDFSIALDKDGKLFAWGSNYFGQLGSPSPSVFQKPAEIKGLPKIRDFACGEQFVGALTLEGKLYTWGYGSDGQLGSPTKQDIPSPHLVDFDKPINQIACGQGQVGILANSELYMFGRGKEGQLGRGSETESPNSCRFSPQFVMSSVLRIACGGSHSFAIVN